VSAAGRGSERIWLVDAASGTPQPFATMRGTAPVTDFVWSPDGRAIAYAEPLRSRQPPRLPYRVVVRPIHGASRLVVTGGTGAAWSPDGHWLAVTRGGYIGGGHFAVVSAKRRRTIGLPATLINGTPIWSPDGRLIAAWRAFRAIDIVTRTGTRVTRIRLGPGNLTAAPIWSRDATHIGLPRFDGWWVARADGRGAAQRLDRIGAFSWAQTYGTQVMHLNDGKPRYDLP
jgi:dipeptidyl aminopeptidase/acylaminoacyl peptidase